jgi:uncharacterized membrane protein
MSPRWHLKFGDQIFGPFDRQELQALLAEGRLAPSSLLAPEGTDDWRPAGEIGEIADLFAAAAPAGKAKPPRIVGDPAADTTLLHVAYALGAASLLTGLSAIAGLVLAYVKRGDVAQTWQASHYRWLIRTLWIWLLFMAIGGLTSPLRLGWLIILAISLWLIWRIAKGWLLVGQLRALPDPTTWI